MTSNWLTMAAAIPDQVLWVFVILGGSVVVLVWTRRRLAKRQQEAEADLMSSPAPSRRQTGMPVSDASQRQLQQSMQQLLLQLEEVSREINSQVDTRLRAMNLLIQEADQKIRELRSLQGISANTPLPTRTLPPPRQEPHPEITSERYAKVYALAERGLTVVEIARELGLMTGEVELILALRRTVSDSTRDGS
jgi:hypothetical protein